jgi:hypothetical protein
MPPHTKKEDYSSAKILTRATPRRRPKTKSASKQAAIDAAIEEEERILQAILAERVSNERPSSSNKGSQLPNLKKNPTQAHLKTKIKICILFLKRTVLGIDPKSFSRLIGLASHWAC